MYTDETSFFVGSSTKAQYPHASRHARVSGTKTFGEKVTVDDDASDERLDRSRITSSAAALASNADISSNRPTASSVSPPIAARVVVVVVTHLVKHRLRSLFAPRAPPRRAERTERTPPNRAERTSRARTPSIDVPRIESTRRRQSRRALASLTKASSGWNMYIIPTKSI
jgi:hypothetical protein